MKAEIPSISPATAYKDIHTYVEIGFIKEVNLLHQTNWLDPNLARGGNGNGNREATSRPQRGTR